MATNRYFLWLERFGLEELRRLAEDGYSEEEIAARCGLKPSVFNVWKKKFPEFAEAIMLGRKESDLGVVKSLYKRATGYNVALKKTYKLKRVDFDPDTGKKIREYEELATGIDESHVPADLKAVLAGARVITAIAARTRTVWVGLWKCRRRIESMIFPIRTLMTYPHPFTKTVNGDTNGQA